MNKRLSNKFHYIIKLLTLAMLNKYLLSLSLSFYSVEQFTLI
jgi:hypothetical protein